MKTASDIARYIVRFFQEHEDPVTNLKLQKLLYYVQGWHLAIFDRPAFNDQIQAWVHGPVVYAVYNDYRSYRWNPVNGAVADPHIDGELKELIDEVLDVYGADSAWDLERRSHREDPWLIARGDLQPDQESTREISVENMSRFFKKQAANA